MSLISQLRSFPNQLTLLRLIFIPFIIINVLEQNYRWALALFVLAGVSDFLDGQLARALHQRTELGRYLDPIADKMLLSTLFLVLSLMHMIPWKVTVLVFSRDICIIVTCAVLYATNTLRSFRPSIFGKLNTLAQIAAVFFVLLYQVRMERWVDWGRQIGLVATFALTLVSGIHYIIDVGRRARSSHGPSPGAPA